MATVLQPYINFDISTGLTVNVLEYTGIYDSVINPTGYGSPNTDINSITATRFVFSSYLQEINSSNAVAILSGYEYLVGGTGSFTYDTKTYNAGDTFISMLSGTPSLGTCTLTTTGRYSSTSGFLPTSIISVNLTPSLVIGTNNLIFADSSYSLEYSIYTTKNISGDTIGAGTYIVGGTVGQTITCNGITYRVNEVFVLVGSYALTGTGFTSLFSTSTTVNQQLSYYANQSQVNLELKVAQSSCGTKPQMVEALQTISTDYYAIQDYFGLNIGTDYSGTQVLFDEIASISANPFFV